MTIKLLNLGMFLEDGELALHVRLIQVVHGKVIVLPWVRLNPVTEVERETVVEGLRVLGEDVLVLFPLVDCR